MLKKKNNKQTIDQINQTRRENKSIIVNHRFLWQEEIGEPEENPICAARGGSAY